MELVSSGSCWSEGQAQADREPVYSQKAASREGMDWGTTYVEVDLGGQRLYVQEAQIVWDAPCHRKCVKGLYHSFRNLQPDL